jgi:hypothetical protein
MRRYRAFRRPRTSKYGAIKTEVDGITFASRAEANRYSELKLLEAAGEISRLELQPKYPLVVNGVKVAEYRGDFLYIQDGHKVLEDVKGAHKSAAYTIFRVKKKLMLACYGIEVLET